MEIRKIILFQSIEFKRKQKEAKDLIKSKKLKKEYFLLMMKKMIPDYQFFSSISKE